MIYIKKKDRLILLSEDEIIAIDYNQNEKKVIVFEKPHGVIFRADNQADRHIIEDVESVTTTETLRVEIDRMEDMRKSHQMMLDMFTKMQDMKNSNTNK